MVRVLILGVGVCRVAGIRHPIGQLADTAEQMTRAARYLGLGTSTLDRTRDPTLGDPAGDGGAAGSWPWRGLVHLADGTRMIINAGSSVRTPELRSSHTLDPAVLATGLLDAFDPARAWYWTRPDLYLTDPDLLAHQHALEALHTFLHATETEPRRHRRATAHRAS